MNKNKLVLSHIRKAFMLSVLFLMVLLSCKKEGELYPEFNNENLSIHFTDTLNIITSLSKDDSIPTLNVSTNLVGIYNDSIFGPASASFFTEVILAGVNVNFGTSPVIDSVVLTMKYTNSAGFYGISNLPLSFDVYRLTEQFTKSEYYSNESLLYDPTPLGSITFTPKMDTTILVMQNGDSTYQDAHLRIPLSNLFGQEILNAGKGTDNINDNTEFQTLVKGLYITPSTTVTNTTLNANEGAILYFDMNSSLSTLTVYYSNEVGSEKSYSFIINSESDKFNHFEHNYAGTEIEKQLTGLAYDSTLTYVQAMGGVKTKLQIPNIKNLGLEGKIIVNKAEIIFNVSDISTNLTTIPKLVLTGIGATGQPTFLADYIEGSDYFGGTYDATSKTYKFNISRHVQDLINNNTTDYGLYLIATESSVLANRSIINSFKHPSNNIKLNITYSKF